jgi:hypothetical protein
VVGGKRDLTTDQARANESTASAAARPNLLGTLDEEVLTRASQHVDKSTSAATSVVANECRLHRAMAKERSSLVARHEGAQRPDVGGFQRTSCGPFRKAAVRNAALTGEKRPERKVRRVETQ